MGPPGSSPSCGVEYQLRPAVGELRAQSGVCVLCSQQLAARVCFSLKEAPVPGCCGRPGCVVSHCSIPGLESAEERKHPLITASVKRSGVGVGKTNPLSSGPGIEPRTPGQRCNLGFFDFVSLVGSFASPVLCCSQW